MRRLRLPSILMALLLGALTIAATALPAGVAVAQAERSEPAWDDDWEDDWNDDGEDEWNDWDDDPWAVEVSPWRWHGFVESAGGRRVRDNRRIDDDMPLGELRLQLEARYEGDLARWDVKADALGDGIASRFTGKLREARVSFPVGTRTDLRIGRQILTWGTGDLLFLNDLFPKDWVSFLIGRDDEYLKAPSDALRVSWFGDTVNVDGVWTPLFEPDRFIDGRRLSYFDPAAGEPVAAPPRLRASKPSQTLDNGELALRLYGMLGSQEWAFYAYRGFYGQPTAFDPATRELGFARLNSAGASLRGPLAGGLYNLEMAWYDSADDRDGDDPNLPNSELRFLAGFERELVADFTLATQYYLEWMQDYDAFEAAFPFDPSHRPDELRHLMTLRLTYRMMRDNLILGMMSFYSPSDEDWFLRPTVQYRYTDRMQINGGANLFGGRSESTFYGQFEDDGSIFLRLRYSF